MDGMMNTNGNETMEISIQNILKEAIEDENVSDVFLIAGLPVTMKRNGHQKRMNTAPLMPDTIQKLVDEIYREGRRERTKLDRMDDDDFSFSMPRRETSQGIFPGGRFRVNIFRQRGSMAAVIRVIRFGLPNAKELGIPEDVLSLTDNGGGLVLVTGMAGTGKSTTLACMIDRINDNRDCHIITMEDPIEYIHRHKKAIVTQREISIDTPGYLEALRSSLRESPDVIFLGEMRDFDTINSALLAAETGVTVLSSLHTNGAADTINRIVDVFPDKEQARMQLAQVLRAVVCQQLVPSTEQDSEGNPVRIPVFEIMKVTDAINNMIRENKVNQLDAVMQSSANEGMCTMDGSLLKLYSQGRISKETALKYRTHYGHEYMEKRLNELK